MHSGREMHANLPVFSSEWRPRVIFSAMLEVQPHFMCACVFPNKWDKEVMEVMEKKKWGAEVRSAGAGFFFLLWKNMALEERGMESGLGEIRVFVSCLLLSFFLLLIFLFSFRKGKVNGGWGSVIIQF